MDNAGPSKVEILIEHGEEVPTDTKKLVKVLELPIFGYEEKRRLDNAIDAVERLSRMAEEGAKEPASLSLISSDVAELRDAVAALGASIQDNDQRIISFLGRSVENAENMGKSVAGVDVSVASLNARLDDIERKFDERMYSVESSLDYSKGVVIEAADRIRLAADETGRKVSMIIENLNEKFDAYITSVNNRIDAMATQALDSINETSSRVDSVRKSVDELKRKRTAIKISLPSTAFEMLAEAKKKIRGKRVPKARQPDKRRLIESLDSIEQRVLDIFIFAALGAKQLSISAVKKEIPVAQSKTARRLSQLVAEGRISRRKKGRYYVFSAA